MSLLANLESTTLKVIAPFFEAGLHLIDLGIELVFASLRETLGVGVELGHVLILLELELRIDFGLEDANLQRRRDADTNDEGHCEPR